MLIRVNFSFQNCRYDCKSIVTKNKATFFALKLFKSTLPTTTEKKNPDRNQTELL